MQYLRPFLCLFFSIFAFSAQAQQAGVIIIAADSWCPINCKAPEAKLGVGIDLAKAIFEPLGYQVRYQIMPWSDALAKVRAGTVDAVVGASRNDDATLVFPAQDVLNISDDFYVTKGDSWRYQGVHTLKGRKLGVVKDYGYGAQVQEYVHSNEGNLSLVQASEGDDALKTNIRKLMNHQLDVVVEAKPVMDYTLASLHQEEALTWAGSSPQSPVYLAFSPALPGSRALADQFDAGMRRLAASGKLAGFYRPYGLTLDAR